MRVAVGVLLGVVFAAGLFWATLSESSVSCEVCMAFGPQEACRTVSAADREHAVAMAVSSACAVLSGGVTQGIRCSQTPPRSVSCTE